MKIITQFNEYSGIVEAGSGYGDIIRVDRDHLIELLQRLPAGNIILSSVHHNEGARGIIAKPDTETEPHWHTLAPTVILEAE